MSKLKIKTKERRFETARDLYGIFFEDINRAGDGGLYPEMLRNRSFEDSVLPEGYIQQIFHVDAALHLLFQQSGDAVAVCLFVAEAVEEDRRLHLAEMLRRKALCQRVAGGVHQLGVEGTADLQRDAAAGACGFCQLSGLFHGGFFGRDTHLASHL